MYSVHYNLQYAYSPDRRSMPVGIPVQTITAHSLQGKTVSSNAGPHILCQLLSSQWGFSNIPQCFQMWSLTSLSNHYVTYPSFFPLFVLHSLLKRNCHRIFRGTFRQKLKYVFQAVRFRVRLLQELL